MVSLVVTGFIEYNRPLYGGVEIDIGGGMSRLIHP